MKLKIAPSILSAHFERLGEDVLAVEQAGADMIHVDVMDGHFVPNLSMGPVVVEALRRVTRLPLDVHLMITEPGKYLDDFVKAGANHVTFHVEVDDDPLELSRALHEQGVGAGICMNPETPVDSVLPLLPHLDMVLIMTVHPGFGGQSFLGDNLEKARRIRDEEKVRPRAQGPIDVEVDGGIDTNTVRLARDSGCNVFVAGNSIFGADDLREAVRLLRDSAEAYGAETPGIGTSRETSPGSGEQSST